MIFNLHEIVRGVLQWRTWESRNSRVYLDSFIIPQVEPVYVTHCAWRFLAIDSCADRRDVYTEMNTLSSARKGTPESIPQLCGHKCKKFPCLSACYH